MSDQEVNANEPAATDGHAAPVRKAWSAPTLTVRSVEDLTLGTRQEVPEGGGRYTS